MDTVERDKNILGGTLVFTGTRVPVKSLFDYLKEGSLPEFLEDFPTVSKSQAMDVLNNAQRAFDAVAA
jgi:uncharacterized protein (DUF433 family)